MACPKALISWSSGKDSAFALYEVLRAGEFDVVGALTTVTETFGRVSIHGVRQEILQAQCVAAGLPQRIVPIPYGRSGRASRCRWNHAYDLRRSISR
jgi:diphthamide synthase (EF-2-diphthine--ammonia ligase)